MEDEKHGCIQWGKREGGAIPINGEQIQVTIGEEVHKAEGWVFTAVHLTI
jgi:hypothetical protein